MDHENIIQIQYGMVFGSKNREQQQNFRLMGGTRKYIV